MLDTITQLLKNAGITGTLLLSTPPDRSLGDVALGCFAIAKEQGKNPAEVANNIVAILADKHADIKNSDAFEQVVATGPYVNFTLSSTWLAEQTARIKEGYGKHTDGNGKKYLV